MTHRHKLYRIPQQGKLKGVCAGIAYYLDIPVQLVRVIVILSLFFGLFMFTLVAYIALSLVLDAIPQSELESVPPPSTAQLLNALGHELHQGEQRLREVERYITSETFTVRSRFGQL